ncbi:mRNA-degrading endonuclease, toxin component of the MazEF toxin-antitoxin module [Singulisphaera sp. GP187]|uniref:type II toxin-antitoxin system PemK/MazF family toxin n=1 Tax=Singulisphaera sp. GP187 TaxID=1882752 RepID=UPI00092B7719|nr:type II toxin-antitoxin system PemK/MazF family toxin [Singulisphaera sp. GP187]SIO36239.1 mRNA-degrading endonuclease, toxin component of the MazEF toxin-antitoxin module [Singulisphaera sp. GP187]
MRIQPGEVYRIQWPYDVAVEKAPYAIVLSEEGANDQQVIVVPLFTENLADSAFRLALPDEVIGRRAVAHADKLTRLAVSHIKEPENGPLGTIEEEVFFDLNLAVGKAIGAHFFPGEFEADWKPPGSKRPERGSIWQSFWQNSKAATRPGLVMSDSSDANAHVILMPLISQPLGKKATLPSCVDLGEYVAQADQIEVVPIHQLREYEDRVDRSKFEAACRAIAHVIGAEL